MHYVCFHYEFEHGDVDLDAECQAGGCPSRRVGFSTTLTDWTDWGLASFRLGRAIKVYETDGHRGNAGSAIWIDNTVGCRFTRRGPTRDPRLRRRCALTGRGSVLTVMAIHPP